MERKLCLSTKQRQWTTNTSSSTTSWPRSTNLRRTTPWRHKVFFFLRSKISANKFPQYYVQSNVFPKRVMTFVWLKMGRGDYHDHAACEIMLVCVSDTWNWRTLDFVFWGLEWTLLKCIWWFHQKSIKIPKYSRWQFS